MSADASGTMDANSETVGPVFVEDQATYVVVTTGTATVTPQISHDQTNWAPYATGLTASGAGVVSGPCFLRLIASSVSGGSSIGSIRTKRAGA